MQNIQIRDSAGAELSRMAIIPSIFVLKDRQRYTQTFCKNGKYENRKKVMKFFNHTKSEKIVTDKPKPTYQPKPPEQTTKEQPKPKKEVKKNFRGNPVGKKQADRFASRTKK